MVKLFKEHPELLPVKPSIDKAITELINSFNIKGKLLVCGSEESVDDSNNLTRSLLKTFVDYRPIPKEIAIKLDLTMRHDLVRGLPVIDLTANKTFIDAMNNDGSSELIYAQQVISYSENCPNDILFCISNNGNSVEVVKAAIAADVLGLHVVALTDMEDSELSKIARVTIKAPCGLKEEILHYIAMELETKLS